MKTDWRRAWRGLTPRVVLGFAALTAALMVACGVYLYQALRLELGARDRDERRTIRRTWVQHGVVVTRPTRDERAHGGDHFINGGVVPAKRCRFVPHSTPNAARALAAK